MCERHPELNLFQISSKLRNIRSYRLSDSEYSEKIPVAFCNSVEDNLVLHGASILDGEDAMFSLSTNWNFTDTFLKQLDYLWDVCCHGVDGLDYNNCSYPNFWNRLTAALMELDAKAGERENHNLILIPDADYAEITNRHIGSQIADQYLIAMMEKNILQIYVENDMVGIEFEDAQIRDCLLKSGNVLELKTYLICKELLEDYSGDVRTSVVIDWDGKIVSKEDLKNEANTVNEVDVLATCGLVPYFISCKNGKCDSEELYKLYTVAERFGTKYAQKIIVTTDLAFALKQHEDVLLQRAEDMEIHVIQNVHKMSNAEWKAKMTEAMELPKLKRKVGV